MASRNTALSIYKINICFDIPNVSALNKGGLWSPKVKVYDIPWRVNVCKEACEGEEMLGVYLYCEQDSEFSNWSYTAHGKFKLLSFNGNQNEREFVLTPDVFDKENPSFGCSFIEWRDLFNATNQYVKNDTISLKIKLEVANPNDEHKSDLILENIDKCCEKSGLGKFRLTVRNIKKLLAVRSPCIVLRNIRWFLTFFKEFDQLSISLNSSNRSEEFSYDVQMMVKLISSKSSVKPIEQIQVKEMNKGDCFEVEQLISWDELLKSQNGFVNNNSIVIEIELKVNKPGSVASNSQKRTVSGPLNEAKQRKMECAICFKGFGTQDVSMTNCGHLFCSKCIQDEIARSKVCPTCRTGASLGQLKRAHLPFVN
ncbi:E3 ubiquitin-protein ligase rnf8-A-like [Sitodiplosis mosellana]|uniref:E3 ubiquitin-protein ligase rnf8-A-like n=1 Tax=Sitodiplosis mosellana TaxID=263140 RepID=UPI002444FB80|nr:E3 ubiquitin-protein ligase rnf8-A-like [Sitodiplosis mosellana]